MSWDAYTVFSVVSGVILVGAGALAPGPRAADRAKICLGGAGLLAYGLYVGHQTSGTYFFPVIIFAVPFGALWYLFRGERQKPATAADGFTEHVPCPRCAEPVRLAAACCRFCGLDFANQPLRPPVLPPAQVDVSMPSSHYDSDDEIHSDIEAALADGVDPDQVRAYWEARNIDGSINDRQYEYALSIINK